MSALFWRLVDDARAAHPRADDRLKAIAAAVAELDGEALVQLDGTIADWFHALDRNDLWAAAYVLMGGCGDDSFSDFRGWLLLQGRDAVDAVIADPQVLATWSYLEWPRAEGLYTIAQQAYHDGEMPAATLQGVANSWPADRFDRTWTEEAADELFPALSARKLWKELAALSR
jgi:hypothetical protein